MNDTICSGTSQPFGEGGVGVDKMCDACQHLSPELPPSYSDFESVPVCSLHDNYKCSKNKKTISEIYFD